MSNKKTKKETIVALFKICQARNNFEFDNELVKKICLTSGFKNPFDVTKLDNTDKFPPILKKNDYAILHLGKGRHKFIKGIQNCFHKFESVDKKEKWEYRPSLLNEFDTSESNILSLVFNQRIAHKFLYGDITTNPKIYGARRTKSDFNCYAGKENIVADKLQMEIDLTAEFNGTVTVFEGKNGFPADFAIYQIYYPFLYYYNLKQRNKLSIKEINCCYLLRQQKNDKSTIRIYQYDFANPKNMASIRHIKSAEYDLVKG